MLSPCMRLIVYHFYLFVWCGHSVIFSIQALMFIHTIIIINTLLYNWQLYDLPTLHINTTPNKGKESENSYQKLKRAHRKQWDVSTLIEVFVNQKRVNLSEKIVKMAHGKSVITYTWVSKHLIFRVFIYVSFMQLNN